MSYTIDVYRGDAKAQRNIIRFGAYVTLFPQLIAGPIVRYQTVADELAHRDCTASLFAGGVKRFVCGMGKKILLANNIGLLWEAAYAQASPTVLTAWLGAIAYGFRLYFDFSGYAVPAPLASKAARCATVAVCICCWQWPRCRASRPWRITMPFSGC